MAKYAGSVVTMGVDDGASGYDEIAQIVDMDLPGIEADDIEVSVRDGDGYGEFISGFKMAGESTFDIVYDPDETTHIQLTTLAGAGTVIGWQFTLPGTGNTIVADAYVKRFKPTAPLKDKLSANITLKFTGEPTFPS